MYIFIEILIYNFMENKKNFPYCVVRIQIFLKKANYIFAKYEPSILVKLSCALIKYYKVIKFIF